MERLLLPPPGRLILPTFVLITCSSWSLTPKTSATYPTLDTTPDVHNIPLSAIVLLSRQILRHFFAAFPFLLAPTFFPPHAPHA